MKILFLCHGHPRLQAGGTEIAALDLFRSLRRLPGIDGLFVGGATALHRPANPGTPWQAVGDEADEVLLHTAGFDRFMLSQTDLHGVAPELERLLRQLRPDIVHLHHVLVVGLEVIHLIRRTCPDARIVLTLHDYHLICANEGLLLDAAQRPCPGPSLDACRRCVPSRSQTDLRLRELHARAMLRHVDQFVSPSVHLRDRFVAWGLPAERIVVLRNGVPAGRALARSAAARRDRFAFLGHINPHKGALVALGASAELSRRRVPHQLVLHGGTDFQPDAFLGRFADALAMAPLARHAGGYARAEVGALIDGCDWVLVPSIWPENAPLVIQEAFRHGRPVITGALGGMAEAVRDGLDGLLVRPNDPLALADAMARAAETPGLWDRLVANIAPPPDPDDAAHDHRALYRALLAPARTKEAA